MKKLVSLILLACMLFTLSSCSEQTQPESPVTFYYRRANVSYTSGSSIVDSEQREGKGHASDITFLLKEYLQGPISQELVSAIPENTKLIKFSQSENSAQVLLSDGFARLSSLDLTICCACITLTVIGLTGVETVQISTQNVPLNNQPHITMNKDCLLLLDNTTLDNTQ